jgi:TatD DNase family protein
MIIDTHSHLNLYDEECEEEITEMANDLIIVSGTNRYDNKENLLLCDKYENIRVSIGFHPMEADNVTEDDFIFIESNINSNRVVAIGEIGIDLYWRQDNFDVQKQIFIKQIELAKKHKKTIVIHSRNSNEEVYDILNECNVGELKVVLHCYSGDYSFALKMMKFNVMFGVGGSITFKNSQKLVNVIENIDLHYILLETDSPYLSPEPFRGKRNKPSNVNIVASKIAEIKGISVEKVIEITTNNAIKQFDLKL